MNTRRLLWVALGATLVGVGLGSGVAIGSGARTKAQAPPPPPATFAGRAGTRSTDRGGSKPAKCLANACVDFGPTGTMYGPHPNVLGVVHPYTGVYCVVLDPKKVAVNAVTPPLISIDWVLSDHYYYYPVWGPNVSGDGSICVGAGVSNAIEIYVFDFESNWANAGLFVAVP